MTNSTTDSHSGVWGSGPNDVYAVGRQGNIFQDDGEDWSAMNSGTNNILSGVWGSSSEDIYTSGYSGTILHYDSGQEITPTPPESPTATHTPIPTATDSPDPTETGTPPNDPHFLFFPTILKNPVL